MALIGDKIHECECGSRNFMKLVQVRQWAGGGAGETPAGYKCGKCGKAMNSDTMSRLERKREAEEKMAEAKQMLKQLEEQDGRATTEEDESDNLENIPFNH